MWSSSSDEEAKIFRLRVQNTINHTNINVSVPLDLSSTEVQHSSTVNLLTDESKNFEQCFGYFQTELEEKIFTEICTLDFL